jgi:hypothetical protein
MQAEPVWKKCCQVEKCFPACKLKISTFNLIIIQPFVPIPAFLPCGKTALKLIFISRTFNLLPLQVST